MGGGHRAAHTTSSQQGGYERKHRAPRVVSGSPGPCPRDGACLACLGRACWASWGCPGQPSSCWACLGTGGGPAACGRRPAAAGRPCPAACAARPGPLRGVSSAARPSRRGRGSGCGSGGDGRASGCATCGGGGAARSMRSFWRCTARAVRLLQVPHLRRVSLSPEPPRRRERESERDRRRSSRRRRSRERERSRWRSGLRSRSPSRPRLLLRRLLRSLPSSRSLPRVLRSRSRLLGRGERARSPPVLGGPERPPSTAAASPAGVRSFFGGSSPVTSAG